jgi:hypothetical protein
MALDRAHGISQIMPDVSIKATPWALINPANNSRNFCAFLRVLNLSFVADLLRFEVADCHPVTRFKAL